MNNRGRPKKEVRKSKVLEVRLNDEEEKMLDYLSEKTRKTKSEIIRTSFEAYRLLIDRFKG